MREIKELQRANEILKKHFEHCVNAMQLRHPKMIDEVLPINLRCGKPECGPLPT